MDKQKKRLRDINNILRVYNEPEIPNSIINKIRIKYPITKHSEHIHTEQINIGDIIQMVNLDLKHVSIKGVCVKIIYSETSTINSILLFNSNLQIFWKINPTKYYIFKSEKKSDETMNIAINDLYTNINNKYKK
jgi:hypothetical protein